MRDEVQRISKLVAEGKLSPEDAADLIDAFYASERGGYEPEEDAPTPPPGPEAGATATEEAKGTNGAHPRDPLRSLVESIEKLTKEGVDSVNWNEVSKQARQSAKKGFDALKSGIEDISKGKVHLGWLATGEAKEVVLPLSLPEGKTLKVENACGDVQIVGGAATGSVTARARFKGATTEDAKAKAEAYTLVIEESDHVVLIRQPDVSGLRVEIEIKVPGHGGVEVRAEAGNVEIQDTKGACRVVTKSGDVKLKGLNGVVEVNGESGDVSIEDATTPSLSVENKNGDISLISVHGNLNLRSATGSVRLKQVGGKTIAIESVSGTIEADLDEPVTGTLNVRTVNGDVKLGIPDGSDSRVSLSTLRGNVSCNLELSDQAKQDQRITGRLGAGAGTLDVSAVTGDVTVELRNAVTA